MENHGADRHQRVQLPFIELMSKGINEVKPCASGNTISDEACVNRALAQQYRAFAPEYRAFG